MTARRNSVRRLVAAAAMAVLAAGCGGSADMSSGRVSAATSSNGGADTSESSFSDGPPELGGSPDAADAAALEEARQRWREAGLADYTLVVEDDCGDCSPGDQPRSRVVAWGGQVYASGAVTTVDDLFARIEGAIDDGLQVAAIYDDETGYPSEVRIGPTQAAVEGGTHLTVHELHGGLPGEEFSSTSFEEAKRRWIETRPDAYEYVVTIACGGCPFAGRLRVKVVGDTVVEEHFDSAGGDESASGVTIDDIFRDLGDLLGSDGGLVDGGVLINGSAEYDADYGYPNWIGLDLEIVEPQEWNRDLPSRLVYMIGRFDPLEADDYCTTVDELFSMDLVEGSDAAYQRQLQRVVALAPPEHRRLWELLLTLVGEPFDYENFNPAADALDETADGLMETCPAVGFFVMNDDGYVTYLQ